MHCQHSTASTKSDICFTKSDIFLSATTALHIAEKKISTHLNCFLQRFNVRSFMILHFSLTEMQKHNLLVDKVDNIGVTFQVPGSFWSGRSGVDRKKKWEAEIVSWDPNYQWPGGKSKKSHCHVFLRGLDPGKAPFKTLLFLLRLP